MKRHHQRHGVVLLLLLALGAVLGLAYFLSGLQEDLVGQGVGDPPVPGAPPAAPVATPVPAAVPQITVSQRVESDRFEVIENKDSRITFKLISNPTKTATLSETAFRRRFGLPATAVAGTVAPAAPTAAGTTTPGGILLSRVASTGGPSGTGTVMGENPKSFQKYIDDANGNDQIDTSDPYAIAPANFKAVGFNERGELIDYDLNAWTVSNNGRRLIMSGNFARGITSVEINSYGENYIWTNSGTMISETYINGNNKVNTKLVENLDLSTITSQITHASGTLSYKQGTQDVVRSLINDRTVREVTSVTEPGKAPRTVSTRDLTSIPGGGTAEWIAPGDGKQGTLSLRDALGETWSFGSVPKDDAKGTYGTKNGDVYYDPAKNRLETGKQSDQFDRHVIQWLPNGDRIDTELNDNGPTILDDIRAVNVDERFIYHKNGDESRTNYGDVGKGREEGFTRRYDPQGNLLHADFPEHRNADGSPKQVYAPLGSFLRDRDRNNDGKIDTNYFLPDGKTVNPNNERTDRNGDGRYSYDEVRDFMSKDVFDKLKGDDEYIGDARGGFDFSGDQDELQAIVATKITGYNDKGNPIYENVEKADDAKTENEAEQEAHDPKKNEGYFFHTQSQNEWDRYWNGQSRLPVIGALGDFLANYQNRQALSNALLGDAYLDEWREKVDREFARANIGTEAWTSEICKDEFKVVGDSVAGVEQPGGLFQFIGTIQADRSDPVPLICNSDGSCKRGTCRTRDHVCIDNKGDIINEFFYKISYGVVAPGDEDLTPYYDEKGAISFNIQLSGPDKTAVLFTEFVNLRNGESAAQRAPQEGQSPILHYSPFTYDKACILFEKKAIDRKGDTIPYICNPIVSASGSFVNFRGARDQQVSQGPTFNNDW